MNKTERIASRLEPDIKKKIKQLAEMNDISESEQIRNIIQYYFKNVLKS